MAGAFELPAALRMALSQGGAPFDGFLLLGCVVRGETDHYEFICDAVCQGVMAIAAETGAAIGFGLLTVDTLPSDLVTITPYVVTLLVLAVASQRLRPPAYAGLPYRSGDSH